MGAIREIVSDCQAASRLARFWAELLDGYAVRPYDQAEMERLARLGLTPDTDPTVMVDGPGPALCFQQVPGRKYENNRLHLDIEVADRKAAIERARGLGGDVLREASGYTVMRDPEGNQFCLVGKALASCAKEQSPPRGSATTNWRSQYALRARWACQSLRPRGVPFATSGDGGMRPCLKERISSASGRSVQAGLFLSVGGGPMVIAMTG